MPKTPEGHQPSPEEVKKAEDMMTERQIRQSEERERVSNEGAEATLMRYANELNYDDRCGGEAIRTFRERLREISKHVKELEEVGYKVRVEGQPVKLGGMSVFLERGGQSIEIYSQFYDTYSEGIYNHESLIHEIKAKIEIALKTAEMFGGGEEKK